MPANDFLSGIQGSRRLSQITVPGSHDAGVYAEGAAGAALGGKSWAICQRGNLRSQCEEGSRFFDIRLNADGKAYHTTGPVGAFGGALTQMLTDVKSFVRANPSEFVILRFSKCKGQKNIVDSVRKDLNDVLYKGTGNIASASLDSVRGKVIATFATKDGFAQFIDAGAGIHGFGKFNGSASGAPGLVTCGSHTGVVSMKKVWKKQMEMVHEHDTHTDDEHLSVLYWTQTAAGLFERKRNIKSFTTGSKGTHARTTDLMTRLKNETQDFRDRGGAVFGVEIVDTRLKRMKMAIARPKMPNIVMYDFVNAATSMQIIELNQPSLRID